MKYLTQILVFCVTTGLTFSDETTHFSTVILEKKSYLCSEMELDSLAKFDLCAFVKIEDIGRAFEYNYSTIFQASDGNLSIELLYDNDYNFIIREGNISTEFFKMIPHNRWIRICLQRTQFVPQIFFYVNYMPVKESSSEKKNSIFPEKEKQTTNASYSSKDPSATKVSLCLGNPNVHEGQSTLMEVAGLDMKLESNESRVIINDVNNQGKIAIETVNFSKGKEFLRCIGVYRDKNVLKFYRNSYEVFEVFYSAYTEEEICRDVQLVVHIIENANYAEHVRKCDSLNGRMLYKDEFDAFGHLIIERSKKFIELENYTSISTWTHGGNIHAETIDEMCHKFYVSKENYTEGSTKARLLLMPCITKVKHNLCLAAASSELYLYGSLSKFDSHFYLERADELFSLYSRKLSLVERKSGMWSLFHDREYFELQDATFPIGRNYWTHQRDKTIKELITFTACREHEFACTSLECVSMASRCNGIVECADGSDEIHCQIIKKKKGYTSSRIPPPRKNEDKFAISYIIKILNIAEIQSTEGKAVIDLNIILLWNDPRLEFWNPARDEKLTCDDIWHPQLKIADGYPYGFKVQSDDYRSSCHALTSFFDVAPKKHHSQTDPYMGDYFEGEDTEVSKHYGGVVTVPCHFQLQKYPFGAQTCKISFWPENAPSEHFKLSPRNQYFTADDNLTLLYKGRIDLGEYYFLDAVQEIVDDERAVVIVIKLQTLYGFHLLNSFLTSFLILLICYATLYFQITDFNERVMVSLTALLVLAALFTQASDSSIKTPYFKLLDVWYVVLIFFGFGIVIFNAIINKLSRMEERKFKAMYLKSDENYEDEHDQMAHGWEQKVKRVNNVARITFAVLFAIFIIFYCLRAGEIL